MKIYSYVEGLEVKFSFWLDLGGILFYTLSPLIDTWLINWHGHSKCPAPPYEGNLNILLPRIPNARICNDSVAVLLLVLIC